MSLTETGLAQTPVRSTRRKLAHGLLALSVLVQLFTASFMALPLEAGSSGLAGMLYEVHESVGLLASLWLAGLMISLVSVPDELGQLFPWRSPRRQLLVKALGMAMSGLATAVEQQRLARAWQGLGLLIMLWMCATGASLALLPATGLEEAAVREWHELGQGALWAYLAGHVGMALRHARHGLPVFRRMFWR
ncbi:MAG: cytochrome b/b6 domain-containing protein [Perlucidibaca sp.]